MKEKKYILTEETREYLGVTLYRIEAATDFSDVKKGDKGAWIESEKNLSHEGNAWVFGNAEVFGNADVFGNAKVYGNAMAFGNAWVFGNAEVSGDAKIESYKDYIVFKNRWSSGRYFTWTRSNNKWTVGCFYGTGEELMKKAYEDSPESGREYERVVRYVESILKEEDLLCK
jgi:hypothetical protein